MKDLGGLGFVVLANHDVLDDPDYPYDLGNIFINGMRATRIQELLVNAALCALDFIE